MTTYVRTPEWNVSTETSQRSDEVWIAPERRETTLIVFKITDTKVIYHQLHNGIKFPTTQDAKDYAIKAGLLVPYSRS